MFYKLLDNSTRILNVNQQDKYDLIFNAAIQSSGNKDILKELIKDELLLSQDLQLKLYRQMAILHRYNTTSFLNYFSKYDKLSKDQINVTEVDLYLYTLILEKMFELSSLQQVIEIANNLEHRLSQQACQDTLLLTSSLVYFWKAVFYNRLGNREGAIKYFTKASSIIRNSKFKETLYYKEEKFTSIYYYENKIKINNINATSFLQKIKFVNPEKEATKKSYSKKEIIRVKYLNGKIKEGKYKKFLQDIEALKCEVI
jgi:hypothetical protein